MQKRRYITDSNDGDTDDINKPISKPPNGGFELRKGGMKPDFSFEARLSLSSDEVKDFYREIVTFARSYGVKVTRSWSRERIYLGRNLFAALSFRARKLAISVALDPMKYAEPKYNAIDVTGVKKYDRTPMLMLVTSQRKMKYAIELLAMLFKAAELSDKGLKVDPIKIPTKSRKRLFEEKLIRLESAGRK